MFRNIKKLEKRIENLEKVIPKLHGLLVNSIPNFPCEHIRNCVCSNCTKKYCAYNPNTIVIATSETIINDVLQI